MSASRRPAEYPSSVVGLDVETTGVDSRSDAIIEVSAVRFEGGELRDTFTRLVDPGRAIPADVVYLTGIGDDDVRGAPTMDEILPDLVEFLGDLPIVAHHASFDLAFLNAAAANRPEFLVGRGGAIDTLVLSRALIPRLPSHRLAALVRFFDIPHERAHRAEDDARAVAILYGKLLEVMDQLGTAILARMAALADSETGKLISVARERAEGRLDPYALPDHGLREGELLRYDNALRIEIPREPREEKLDVDLDALETLFDESGAIAARLAGYETRREQLQMMRAVGDTLSGGVHLVVEAGTGVGKSLAYLVPAVHFAVANGERVIVSTNTRNLQEQLFQKDVPFLERALDVPFSAALLKGRGNYLCMQRWRQILEKGLSASERADLLPLVVWEQETRSGDVSENGGFHHRGYLWSRLSAEGGPCLGGKCPFSDKCYLLAARRASQAAHIVVVNHSLLFSDTETENRILGDYAYLICDEAHNIERVATEHLGRRANVWRARATLDGLHRVDGDESGDLSDLLESLGSLDETGVGGAVRAAAERLRDDVGTARGAVEAFFSALSSRHERLNLGRPVEFGKLRYRHEEPVSSIVPDELRDATEALDTLSRQSLALADLVADSDVPQADSVYQNLTFHAGRIESLARDLEYLASAEDDESVFWLELRTYRETPECELKSAPVSVAEKMEEFLYARVDSIVMTSATLTVDGRFGFITERLGLDTLPDWRVLTLDVGSPYDYDSQAVVAVAGHLPMPSSAGFNSVVADLVVKLGGAAAGGTLVLFTSRSALDAVFKAVRDPLTARGKLVLGQGHGGSATALLDQFARETDSVLLATSSFWEGVDVPGRSLEQLVIAKLPFPVPSDPVTEAHCERYDDVGESSFERYMIPRTAIRVRQGFGRLIRSTTDVGAVIFLDSRLSSRRYGRRLLDELPTEVSIVRSDVELMSVLSAVHAGRAQVRRG